MEGEPRLEGPLEHGEGKGEASDAVGSKPRPTARQTFEDCPLIEIVHFHECLRGELRSLKTNVETLCRKVRDRHQNSISTADVHAPPSSKQDDEDPAAPAPMVLQLEEEGDGEHTKSGSTAAAAATTTTEDAARSFDGEDLKLEVQVQSQFRLLWAVFQSHSTAEDEVIWPALKEKARSSGGKLKLVNHEADSSTAALPAAAAALPAALPAATTLATTLEAAGGQPNDASGSSGEPRKHEAQAPRSSRSDGDLAAAAAREAGRPSAEAVGVGSGGGGIGLASGGEDRAQQVGAMIDESEYKEDHHEERRLFEGMQELLTGLRNTRNSSVPERLKVVAWLGKKTDEMCSHLMTHLDKEEESALPLIKHYFTGPEMGALVGKIMGKRPTELMQTILAMMIKNLPAEEVHTVMGYMRHAVKDTYFEKWLASGGFQWPTNPNTNTPSNKADGLTSRRNGGLDGKGLSAGAVKPSGGGGGPGGGCSGCGCHPTAAASNVPIMAAAASRTTSTQASAAAMDTPSGLTPHTDGNGERRGGGGIKRPGVPLGAANAAAAGGTCRRGGQRDGCCHLDRDFEGMTLNSGASGAIRGPGGGGADAWGRLASGQGEADKGCSVCSYIGRCPVNEPLSQAEFESTVKRLSHVSGLSTERKSGLVQMLRNHMYQGRKRPRPSSMSGSTPGGAAGPSSLSPHPAWTFPTGAPRPPTARAAGGAAGVALAAPARHYTSTQPDVEDATGSSGGSSRDGSPPALFTQEELAPTYHVAPVGGGGGGGAVGEGAPQDAQPGVLGCPHYRRACKIRAPCCQKLFTCRLCHDHSSDHTMDRGEVTEMLCMRCGTLQPVHSECRNPSCRPTEAEKIPPDTGRKLARYYCDICHLFDDDPQKDIYHCPYCNMCRLGKGLGVDFFHCMTCNACISSETPTHACFRKGMESDCPICNTSLFTSTSQVKGLRCGHFMHLACYKEYIGRAESREFWYRCPVCRKSMEDMREYFSQMDSMVASQPMPEEYSGWKTKVLCYDCEHYSEVPYHFYYLKCGDCGSYNTRKEGKMLREGATGAAAAPSHPPPRAPAPPSGGPAGEDGHSAPPGP